MRVLVYVEGPSDRAALSALLRPVIEQGQELGVGISFHPQNGKSRLLEAVPRRAAGHLAEYPEDLVIALPDLYPATAHSGPVAKERGYPALEALLGGRFEEHADRLRLSETSRQRFRVHCLQHDLECLLLAAPDQLRLRLGTKEKIESAWRLPVEDQNEERPPKQVVEDLFRKHRRKPSYTDTTDAPWILKRADLGLVEKACPQRFAPFVNELREAIKGGTSAG